MKRAIAITLYDKFEELAILIDIIRENFTENYLIVVCSNHPEGSEKAKRLKVDSYIQGEEIFFSPSLPWEQKRPLLVCRGVDGVIKSCQAAIDLGAEVVVHTHCDGWMLDEKSLLDHFDKLTDDAPFLARGLGFEYIGQDVPLGHMDDHFFFFQSKAHDACGFFDFQGINFFPHRLSIHGMLVLRVLSHLGIGACKFYDHHEGAECWPGREKILPWNPVTPSNYDPQRGFLHVHRQAFPGELGPQLQAHYLRKKGLSQGMNLERFLQRYNWGDELLISELEKRYVQLTKALKKRLIMTEGFGQELVLLEEAVKNLTVVSSIKNLVVNLGRKLLYNIGLQRKVRRDVYPLYPESIWPDGNFIEQYNKHIQPEWIPSEKGHWYEK